MTARERHSLTTRQLAESLGVSESSVKRWIDDGTIAAERTAGGHRRIPMAAAVRFMRRYGMSPDRPEAMPLSITPALGRVDPHAADACFEAFLRDDSARARAIITGRYICGADIAAIGDGLLRPALERIGELWKDDPQGILLEHRAVDTSLRALADLLAWLPPAPPGAPVAVTAAGPDDPYLLPPMLASMTLLEHGVHARNLGPLTPFGMIVLAAERYRASTCSLSVSVAQDRRHHAEWNRMIDGLRDTGAQIVVGGRCVSTLSPEILRRVDAAASMAELGAYAAGLVHGVGPGRNRFTVHKAR